MCRTISITFFNGGYMEEGRVENWEKTLLNFNLNIAMCLTYYMEHVLLLLKVLLFRYTCLL